MMKLTFGGYSSMSFDTYLDSHNCLTTQTQENSFTPPNSCILSLGNQTLPTLLTHSNHWPTSHPYTSVFLRTSLRWNHRACHFLSPVSFTQYKAFEIHLLYTSIFIPFYCWAVSHSSFTHSHMEGHRFVSGFWPLQIKLLSTLYTSFSMNTNFHLSIGVNT